YKQNPDAINNVWLLWYSNRRYFPNVGKLAICLVYIGGDSWLLTTVKRITKILPNVKNGIGYEAEEIEQYQKYYGRVIVKYHNTNRTPVRLYEKIKNKLEVVEILNSQYMGDEFPGYDNIRLSYDELSNVINRHAGGWFGALNNQKAVYLITDTSNGKLYVGSATAKNGMLWSRWSDYIANGHGGNKELVAIVNDTAKGFEYIKNNFQYTVLENFNSKVDDSYILSREAWWKKVFCSRKFGYNSN
ncbi:GIY-YIG nuclease family protein, partial [Phascolarctobacterium sp.]